MIEMEVDAEALRALGRALKSEADGKELRKDLIKNLKKPLVPAVQKIKSSILAMPSSGGSAGESLRRGVAKRIRAEAKLSGRNAGVRVRARKTPTVRGFRDAPKRLNSRKGWRHPVFGNRNLWVTQIGRPGFFDDPLNERKPELRRAVLEAMEDTARRIASKARS